MFTLVVGGASSGKSEYAESLLPNGGIYIATMRPYGDESLERIARHRAMRARKGFSTAECYTDLGELDIPAGSDALLECIGNLTANELFGGAGESTAGAVVNGVLRLSDICRRLVVVSNDVSSGGSGYGVETVNYMRTIGEINLRLARAADSVCEVVCGMAIYYKGAER